MNAKELHHVAYIVKNADKVPSDRLHKKKSDTVETDFVAAAEPISNGIPAKIKIIIILLWDCIIAKRLWIDIDIDHMHSITYTPFTLV